jgi:hypothetical protein
MGNIARPAQHQLQRHSARPVLALDALSASSARTSKNRSQSAVSEPTRLSALWFFAHLGGVAQLQSAFGGYQKRGFPVAQAESDLPTVNHIRQPARAVMSRLRAERMNSASPMA